MATKIKVLKLLQEIRGHAQITNRRPAPRPPVLYLMQLRAQPAPAELPKHRVTITTDAKAFANGPLPIKINHVKANRPGQPVGIC
ncbi:MAG: hypothetical protein V9H26_22870 [Verrucomicrobiota bacterium]|nr:hypothetical protein [Verrucomicrobiota bacterium]MCC6821814.1 hypothetical protein [Limisphaerales bacterium]